ncbi:branched-chain amino acid transporter ATP-binding protein [Candidatus Symbiobacter mobilis CR]|uniref:Branched-chain amino acid transporter ATP-binding protein n=2 Tax=Candidatus Symbiobacter TaxID=1436289 RepID=U5N4P7_9BURK|nr:branched-chain amino acid transporter ATP-binding protein [Candidatus Symbiobacter mobilis CR]
MLEARSLHIGYGATPVVHGIDFTVQAGELVCLIGANGAGKSTVMRALTGQLPISAGELLYRGRSLRDFAPWELIREGLALVPEGRGVFTRMTVLENLYLGAYTRNDDGVEGDIDQVFHTFPLLRERARQLAGTLSGGERQMLAVGRALMARPQVLLLDEPSMGLSPRMADTMFEVLRELHAKPATILLVEQNARRALSIADRGYVMECGKLPLTGTAQELLHDPAVQRAYLGG